MARKPISARLDEAFKADIESSKRHWTQVKEAAEARLDDASVPESWKERAHKDIARAESALERLARGEEVSIWS